MSILIVDDSADNRLLLETLLEDAGYAFVTAQSAREAYHHLNMDAPDDQACSVDCILMDIMMPEISGIEAVKDIRKRESLRDIPVIMVTAKSEDPDLVEAFDAGAMDYVTKPIHETQLLTRLKSALSLKRETDARKAREQELTLLRDELLQKNIQLSRALKEIRDDVEAAGRIQKSLLPDKKATFLSLSVGWYFEPCSKVGGDLLNLVQIDPNHVAFYLFDVSGHGVQAALLAVSIHRLLSAWSGGANLIRKASGEPFAPREVVTMLNKEFPMSNNLQYFTITYGIIDVLTGIVTVVRAGQTPLILQSANGDIKVLEEGTMPVGIQRDSVFEEQTITLGKGDRLFLYSDGVTEARRACPREEFGEERLHESIRKTAGGNLETAVAGVIADLKTWLGEAEPHDDISLLGIERTSSVSE